MPILSRRSAGLLIVSPATAFGTQANSKIGVAVLGTGNRGRYDAKFFGDDPRVQVTAICDIYPNQIDQMKTQVPAAAGARVFKDAAEMLSQPGIDAVQITTPVYLHPEHFEAAVRAGKHVYCEKPAGASVAGVKRTLRAAQSAKPAQVIFFGFQQRYSPEYLTAYDIVNSGKLGELLLMRAEWMVGGVRLNAPKPPESDWKTRVWYPFRETSGDFIVEQDCHGIDVLNWFAGAHPSSAIGGGSRRVKSRIGDNLDNVNVTYSYADGLRGYLHGTQLAQNYGLVREQFFGGLGTIETHRKYYEWMRGPNDKVRAESKREITIDAIEQFLNHVSEGKPANHAQEACDSTFTALLGRMAVDQARQVTWEEMLATG